MGDLSGKLHIEKCSLEVEGDDTYTYLLDTLDVEPDWDVEQWEFSNGNLGQQIGNTRLRFSLQWGYFEPAVNSPVLGHADLLKKFLDQLTVNLIPDASQPDKFEVLLNFENLDNLLSVEKGTISKNAQVPLQTRKRLSSSELQFFNFI